MTAHCTFRDWSWRFVFTFVLTILTTELSAQVSLSPIYPIPNDVSPPLFEGRWDYSPTIAPDSIPRKVVVTSDGVVWIAGNGGILRRINGDTAVIVDHWADGRNDPVPSIISYDMIALDKEHILASTIWREIFVAGPEGLTEVSPRGTSGDFSFADLPDGRLAIGLNDNRIYSGFETEVSKKLARRILLVRNVERLVVSQGTLFGINDGNLVRIDSETGEKIEQFAYSDMSDGIASARTMQDGRIMIATTPHYGTGGCYIVDVNSHDQTTSIFEGPCYDLIELKDGDIWAATDRGIYRHFGSNWQRYFTDAVNGIGRQGRFAATDAGSLWTATTVGLWRHYLHTKEVPAPEPERLTALHRDAAGRLLLGYESGSVYLDDAGSWKQLLPAQKKNSYSRLPLFSNTFDNAVAILHSSGLYKLDDSELKLVSEFEHPEESSVAPVAFTVCPNGEIFGGFSWTTTVPQLVDGQWVPSYTLQSKVGGSAVSDLVCDPQGNLWALGTETIGHRTAEGHWFETESFPLRSNAKGNLFGTLLIDEGGIGVTAWGPWGFAIASEMEGNKLRSRAINFTPDMPYVFYDAFLVNGSELVLTDRGLFIWQDETLVRIPLVEERLQRVATAMSGNAHENSAFGFNLDLAADGALFSVSPSRHIPGLATSNPTHMFVKHPSARLGFNLDGRAYPTTEGKLTMAFEPPLQDDALTIQPNGDVIVTNLAPDQKYVYEARFIDAAGQVSNPVEGTLLYDRPLWLNPMVWAAGTMVFLLSLFMLSRSPYVLDLMFRRFGRRRWQVLLGTADRRVALYVDDTGRLRSDLSATGATLNLGARSASNFPIERLESLALRMTTLALASNSAAGRKNFSEALSTLTDEMNEALPTELCFELQSIEIGKNVLLEVSRDLSGLPWDLLKGRDAKPLFASSVLSRIVRTDRFAKHPGLGGRLSAVIFVAGSSGPEKEIWRAEQARVMHAMHSAGVMEIKMLEGQDAFRTLEDWLDGTDIIHLIGHASAERSNGGSARFWFDQDVAIDVNRLREALSKVAHPPALVFMNACGTLLEGDDSGGATLAGLATPFLEVGSTFVGTQWPVQTAFASELAVDFYTRVLPPSNAIVWRWLRRRPLEGQNFAAALADARSALVSRSPATDPTWSSYTIFGEPTARLLLA